MNARPDFAPEWQRLDLLTACVGAQRRGEPITEELKTQLRSAHQKVEQLRRKPDWRRLTLHHGLRGLDQDILACAAAPDAEPRLGWAYQELQPGVASTYPTGALVRELLFLDPDGGMALREHVRPGSVLHRAGLLEPATEHFQPLRPTALARHALLGWPVTTPALPPGAAEVAVRAGWEHLVLPPECIRALQEVLLWVRHRDRVEKEWGARPSGGPVALFAGPSGTGKTFAAEVLAHALGYRLWRADLGLLVSKYVGETEKNLNTLLDAAADAPILLLFDEADALFGRRAEIKDARDRYANMEVSHLLSRIELHRGPCILTTNLRQHVDSAFLRRFHAVVEFPRPDAAARGALWRLHLPPRAPRAATLDADILGQALPLSGGQIRNAALRAALLAAEEETAISMGHAARAVWAELAKDTRELAPGMLGALAAYLEETA